MEILRPRLDFHLFRCIFSPSDPPAADPSRSATGPPGKNGDPMHPHSTMSTEEFRKKIYLLVREIPRGKTATYGQLAFLAGFPRHSRMVGRILSTIPRRLSLPCHRVVSASGRCAPHWSEQAELLRKEGVVFLPGNRVNLKLCLWNCYGESPAASSFSSKRGAGPLDKNHGCV